MNEGTAKNTNRELWRKYKDDFYSPHIFVTDRGEIGISVGGVCYIHEIELWHKHAPRVPPPIPYNIKELAEELAGCTRITKDNDLDFDVAKAAAIIAAFIESQKPKVAKDVTELARSILTPYGCNNEEELESCVITGAAKIAAFCESREIKLRAENERLRDLVAKIRTLQVGDVEAVSREWQRGFENYRNRIYGTIDAQAALKDDTNNVEDERK